MKLSRPDPNIIPHPISEWIIIPGGAGSVGQYAVQLAKACGFKVLASCSAKSASLVTRLRADSTFDYRKSEEQQLRDIKTITDGHFSRVYDTVAKTMGMALKALTELSAGSKKYFVTTDDW
ncbi:MAG: hypothetical protein M1830_009759 [Pleopsidium flavum]|nr:MAG: hypothetical protein M1830_009759 [Pleopsidium flavum]